MAFLPNFAHDVFVSYAHVDDEPDTYGIPWVSTFVHDLRLALAQQLGHPEKLDVYQDKEKLQAGQELERLKQGLKQSAILLAVGTPSYLRRPWTTDEFSIFRAAAPGSERAIVIEKLPLNEQDLPTSMKDIVRPKFFEVGERMSFGRNYRTDRYSVQIANLAHDIIDRFQKMDVAPPPPSNAAVVLGRVTDDLHKDREQIRRTLGQFNIGVIPADDYPDDGARFKERFLADVALAKEAERAVFVQLVGPYPSKRPQEFPAGYETFQIDAARAAGLDVVLWRRSEIDLASVDDDQHAALLAEAASMTLEALKTEVLRLCQPVPAEVPPPTTDFVFINTDQSDLAVARSIHTALKNRNIGAAVPDFGEPLRPQIVAGALVCDTIVFVFGEARPGWLARQMLQYKKLEPDRRKPLRLMRIFRAPPEPKTDPDTYLPEARAVASVEELIAHLTS